MDILAVTDFPDIRKKVAIQSAESGSLLIIPREGGYLVRMYIELDELHGNERAADRQVSSTMLAVKARAILSPYTLDVKEVSWWSAYEIGQRVCDAFDNVSNEDRELQTPDIFIAGDACHTHSPKAGQGMNVGMAAIQHSPDIFYTRGIDRTNGALIVVRPDQYIANVLPLDDFVSLKTFFDPFMSV